MRAISLLVFFALIFFPLNGVAEDSTIRSVPTPIVLRSSPVPEATAATEKDRGELKKTEVEEVDAFIVSTPSPSCTRPVRLRAIRGPTGTFVRKGPKLSVSKVEATIRNSSSCAAQDVLILVKYPDGDVVPLNGPNQLEKYESDKYFVEKTKELRSLGDLKLELHCSNCR